MIIPPRLVSVRGVSCGGIDVIVARNTQFTSHFVLAGLISEPGPLAMKRFALATDAFKLFGFIRGAIERGTYRIDDHFDLSVDRYVEPEDYSTLPHFGKF